MCIHKRQCKAETVSVFEFESDPQMRKRVGKREGPYSRLARMRKENRRSVVTSALALALLIALGVGGMRRWQRYGRWCGQKRAVMTEDGGDDEDGQGQG